MPQGCPASPLIFILVGEALARAIKEDSGIKGIRVGEIEYRLTQFADDTQLLLGGYKYLKRTFAILKEYEDATGMRANKKKFEGIRGGPLQRKPVPLIPELHTEVIKWVQPGDYVRILGIPFWEQFDIKLFYEKLYNKHKSIIAAWRDHTHLTLVGRSMLTNSIIYGRFRFYVQVEPMPKQIQEAVIQDAQAMVWGKEVEFDPEEQGTELSNRR